MSEGRLQFVEGGSRQPSPASGLLVGELGRWLVRIGQLMAAPAGDVPAVALEVPHLLVGRGVRQLATHDFGDLVLVHGPLAPVPQDRQLEGFGAPGHGQPHAVLDQVRAVDALKLDERAVEFGARWRRHARIRSTRSLAARAVRSSTS